MNGAKTILVIDDDQKLSFGLVAVLRRAGFQTKTASSGAEGLKSIRAEKPDVILCDIMMPPPNGIQLKKELSNDPETRRIPFLFLSARTAQVDKLAGLENGADDYITKPFEVNELLARIQAILRRDMLGRERGIQESAANVDKLRTSISANLSHEMRTPLTILMATLDLVMREKFTENNAELSEYVKTASNSALRLKFLIEDLELLYDMAQDKLGTTRERIDVQYHIHDAIEQVAKAWESKLLEVKVSINPDVVIFAPQREFRHAIAHLIDNACKFSPKKGKVIVSVQPNGMGGCFLEVSDQGPGIPLELREKVFERYYQISQGDTRQHGGLGIGLTLVRAFSQSVKGDVQIMDSPVGCRVRMVLPPIELD